MKSKGLLVRWNKDRGFGFIKSSSIKGDVFIHITELKKMSRAPQVNDVIYFDAITEGPDKTKAINAVIEGVSEKTIKRQRKQHKPNNRFSYLFSFAIFFGVVFVAYSTYPVWSDKVINSLPVNLVNEDFSAYRCEGKQYCNEMTSCKEARFYLKNCPNVKIDGNNDGVPCESQWCN
jgi:cold shock CspA family protein